MCARETRKIYLAVDVGASGGRASAGWLADDRLITQEVDRFEHFRVVTEGRVRSDMGELRRSVSRVLEVAAANLSREPYSVAIDAWGADFGLLDEGGDLISNPLHYSGIGTDEIMDMVADLLPRKQLYETTGMQFMRTNTIFQLFALAIAHDKSLQQAKTLLMIPDLLRYYLTGEITSELTVASTTQGLEIRTGRWARRVFVSLGIDPEILPPIESPGERIWPLQLDAPLAREYKHLVVMAPASHDTASAVAGIPCKEGSWAYLSCGTCSILGVESEAPHVTERAFANNVANVHGACGKTLVQKNVGGLGLLADLKRQVDLAPQQHHGQQLADASGQHHDCFAHFVDPDDERLCRRDRAERVLSKYFAATGQSQPTRPEDLLRCVMQSLVLKYRVVLDQLEETLDRKIDTVHLVGGGAKDHLLCQWAADALGRPVVAGPSEASTVGNLMVQAIASGEVSDLGEARGILRRSMATREYLPRRSGTWDRALDRYLTFLQAEGARQSGSAACAGG